MKTLARGTVAAEQCVARRVDLGPVSRDLALAERVPGLAAVFAYNASRHASTGFSPHYLLFGTEALFPVDGLTPPRANSTASALEFRTRTEALLSSAREAANASLTKTHVSQKARFDEHHRDATFAVGDQVSIKMPPAAGTPAKFASPWRIAYTVVDRIGDLNYKIVKDGRSQVVHVSRLKRYFDRLPDLVVPTDTPLAADPPASAPVRFVAATPAQPAPDPRMDPSADADIEEEDDGIYTVRSIIDRRSVYKHGARSFEYLVNWEGYPDDHVTWQTTPSLHNCQRLMEDYDRLHPRPQRRRQK